MLRYRTQAAVMRKSIKKEGEFSVGGLQRLEEMTTKVA